MCSKMDLDLVPRMDGEVVDADSISVVELYKIVSATVLINTLGSVYKPL